MYSLEKRNPFSSPILPSRRDQTAIRLVFVQNTATIYASPEEGGKVFHRLVHAVETLLHLASRSLPGPSLSGCAQPPVSRGPRCNCARIRRFPRQVTFHHLQITPVEVARVEVRCLFGHHLLVKQFFLISDCYNTQKLVSDN